MKNLKLFFVTIVLAIIAVAFIPNTSTAQTTTQSQVGTYTLDVNQLSPQARAEIENQMKTTEMVKKIEQYGKWAGVGKEVGIAINEGLTAVVDVADKFGKTNVGQITIGLIVWKVIGKDIVRLIIGLIILFVLLSVIIHSYYRTIISPIRTKKILKSKKGWWFLSKKEFQYEKVDISWEYPNAAGALHLILVLVVIGISSLIMFA